MSEFFLASNPSPLASTSVHQDTTNAEVAVAAMAAAVGAASTTGPVSTSTHMHGIVGTSATQQSGSTTLPPLSLSSSQQQPPLPPPPRQQYHHHQHIQLRHNNMTSNMHNMFSAGLPRILPTRPSSSTLIHSQSQQQQQQQQQQLPHRYQSSQQSQPSQQPLNLSLPPPVALQAPPPSIGSSLQVARFERLETSQPPTIMSLPPIMPIALENNDIGNNTGGNSGIMTGVGSNNPGEGGGNIGGNFGISFGNVNPVYGASQMNMDVNVNVNTNAGLNVGGDGSRSGSGSSSVEAIGGGASAVNSTNISTGGGVGGAMSNYGAYQGILDLVGAAAASNPPGPSTRVGLLGKREREFEREGKGETLKKEKQKDLGWGAQQVDDNCCAICFEEWTSEGEHRLVCLSCGHLFGRKCVLQWLKRVKKCPSCKKRASAKDARTLYGVPAKLSVNNTGKIEALKKQLLKERKAHGETRSQLLTSKHKMKVFQNKVRELQQNQLVTPGEVPLPGGWPTMDLVATITTNGHSKAFEFGANGTFAFGEKGGYSIDGNQLCHSHVLQPHIVTRPGTQFQGFITDIRTNNNISSPYYGSLAVVSSDRHLRLIDTDYNLSLARSIDDMPMSVCWFPGSEHDIAVGTMYGFVKVYDARYSGNTEPKYTFNTFTRGPRNAAAPGVHSLEVHESSQTLVAGSSRNTTAINISATNMESSYVTHTTNVGDCGSGLALSNDLLVIASRPTAQSPAVVQPYPYLHFAPSYHMTGTAGRLGEPFGPPLQGHVAVRPFARCTALVSGLHGEGGAIVATADDTRLGSPNASKFRGMVWAAPSIDPTSGTNPDWRMMKTRETFNQPLTDFRSVRPPNERRTNISYLGMLCDSQLNVYKTQFHS